MYADDFQSAGSIPARTTVAFRIAGGAQPLVLVPVNVEGAGPFEFILDTGAGTTLLAPELAQRFNVQITGSKQGQTAGGTVPVQLGRVRSLGIHRLAQRDLDVAITDLSHLGRAVGATIHGDIGYNFLKHYRVIIDYRAAKLTLENPLRVNVFGATPLTEAPMQLAHPAKPLILIEAHVNGRGPLRFAIDTGTSTSAISADIARDLGLNGTPIGPVNTGGGQLQMRATRLDSLRVGRCEVRDVDVLIGEFLTMLSNVVGTTLDGIVGYNFLRHHKVIIDYPGQSFSLHAA